MNHRLAQLVSFCLLCSGVAFADKLSDRPGTKDPALFSRMPHFYLSSANPVREMQYDYYEFGVAQGNVVVRQRVEGHKTVYDYTFDASSGPPPSGLQIARNYQNAVVSQGGEVLYDGPAHRDNYNRMTFRISKNGQQIWAEVMVRGQSYYLTIVERQVMHQNVVANAEALRSGLTQSGHVEIRGIFFDFAKSELKTESEPALKELASLLQHSPALKVWVVGHTDNVGSAEGNVALSNARAAAVVRALTARYAINATRLAPHGAGPFAPVATNNTEEGRSRNRRVEIVAQPET